MRRAKDMRSMIQRVPLRLYIRAVDLGSPAVMLLCRKVQAGILYQQTRQCLGLGWRRGRVVGSHTLEEAQPFLIQGTLAMPREPCMPRVSHDNRLAIIRFLLLRPYMKSNHSATPLAAASDQTTSLCTLCRPRSGPYAKTRASADSQRLCEAQASSAIHSSECKARHSQAPSSSY